MFIFITEGEYDGSFVDTDAVINPLGGQVLDAASVNRTMQRNWLWHLQKSGGSIRGPYDWLPLDIGCLNNCFRGTAIIKGKQIPVGRMVEHVVNGVVRVLGLSDRHRTLYGFEQYFCGGQPELSEVSGSGEFGRAIPPWETHEFGGNICTRLGKKSYSSANELYRGGFDKVIEAVSSLLLPFLS